MKHAKAFLVALVFVSLSLAAWAGFRHDNIIFAVDVSSSVSESKKIDTEKSIMSRMNARFPDYVRASGIIVFGGQNVIVEWLEPPMIWDRGRFEQDIQKIKNEKGGGTPLAIALRWIREELPGLKGRTAVVVFTDDPHSRESLRHLRERFGPKTCVYVINLADKPAKPKARGEQPKHKHDNHHKAKERPEHPRHQDGSTCEHHHQHHGKAVAGQPAQPKCENCPQAGQCENCPHAGQCENCPQVKHHRHEGHHRRGDAPACGRMVYASELASDAGIQALVDEIFPSEAAPAAPPPPAPVAETDADHDGVIDSSDACPGTPKGAGVDDRGCWVIKINFDSGSAAIKTADNAELDNVAEVLKANPDLKIEIEGHTDSQGGRNDNVALSQARAKAVMDYLAGKGIASDRMTSVGYGPDKPIADNANADGRAENRRIEIKVK